MKFLLTIGYIFFSWGGREGGEGVRVRAGRQGSQGSEGGREGGGVERGGEGTDGAEPLREVRPWRSLPPPPRQINVCFRTARI